MKKKRTQTISVLMSAWGTSACVGKSISSVLAQVLPPAWQLELLVGVDADDVTLGEVLKHQDPRMVVVSMRANVGTYQVLNTLLARARGKFIAILDSDDIAAPDRLSRSIGMFVADRSLDLVGSRCARVVEHTRRRQADQGGGPPHSTWLCRANVYWFLGGYKPMRCGGDSDFLARARNHGFKIEISKEIWVTRIIRDSSLCRDPKTKFGSRARTSAIKEVKKEQGLAPKTGTRFRLSPSPHRVLRDARRQPRLDPSLDMVPTSGWSVTRACAVGLYHAVARAGCSTVVEFGSGLSTMALAIHALRTGCSVISYEHDKTWADMIRTKLQKVGAHHLVDVRHVPLRRQTHHGVTSTSYVVGDAPKGIDFVFIDGPPAKVGRLGTLPSIASNLSNSGWTVWVHDALRQPERECVSAWKEKLPLSFTSSVSKELDHRGICTITSSPKTKS